MKRLRKDPEEINRLRKSEASITAAEERVDSAAVKYKSIWREFILKGLNEEEKDQMIGGMIVEELKEMGSYSELIMDIVSSMIVSQQKVLRDDLNTEDEGRKTREKVIQNLFSFSTYVSYLLNYLWERRSQSNRNFTKTVIAWISRQTQQVINALISIKDFLHISEIQYSNTASMNGPIMTINVTFRI